MTDLRRRSLTIAHDITDVHRAVDEHRAERSLMVRPWFGGAAICTADGAPFVTMDPDVFE